MSTDVTVPSGSTPDPPSAGDAANSHGAVPTTTGAPLGVMPSEAPSRGASIYDVAESPALEAHAATSRRTAGTGRAVVPVPAPEIQVGRLSTASTHRYHHFGRVFHALCTTHAQAKGVWVHIIFTRHPRDALEGKGPQRRLQ